MKIAWVGNRSPQGFVGGTELVMQAQARALEERGHEVLRFHYDHDLLSSREEFDVVHVHQWPLAHWTRVRRLSKLAPVVLSLHDHFASCPRAFRVPQGAAECPPSAPDSNCATCVAALVGEFDPRKLRPRLEDRWQGFRDELRAASAVITPSEHLRMSLSQELELSGSDWEVITHGLCRDLSRPQEKASGVLAGDDGKLTVLSFGNRARVKGALDLVRAMVQLPKGSARLILAGQPVEEGFDACLRSAAGDLELELHDDYDERSLEALAARADLAAFPSRAAESYGLVVEEALALGLPTFVSDRGALPEVLEGAAGQVSLPGRVLPAESVEAWTKALNELVESPDRLQDLRAHLPAEARRVTDGVGRLESIYMERLRTQPVPGV